jgi:hypothetical protein
MKEARGTMMDGRVQERKQENTKESKTKANGGRKVEGKRPHAPTNVHEAHNVSLRSDKVRPEKC